MADKKTTKETKETKDTKDTGFFETKGTAYANLPKANEPVTSGPYDPSVLGTDKEGQIPEQPKDQK